jgi:transcription antitermination factor NusG
MAHAYTPGLKVTERMTISKRRILPLKGKVVVKVGDKVAPDDVVARTDLPGNVEPMNVANILGVPPEDVSDCMMKKEGDSVKQGEAIAQTKSFFGLFKSEAKSKIDGTVENVSSVTGQVLLRGHPIPVEVKAYIDGKITEVFPDEGVRVETSGSFVQGIFGIGGETHGEIRIVTPDCKTPLTDTLIDNSCEGKILVGGSIVTADAIRKAMAVKAKGIVVGGLDDKDLREFLGTDIGVAITGSEDINVTVVVTEGFGQINMADRTFELLKSKEGKMACINGATQIRAGVIRPEVVIPSSASESKQVGAESSMSHGLAVGSPVRVIRQPYFGKLGKVAELQPELQKLESESKARILTVEFADGVKAIIPRANVELIEQ